MGKTKIKGLLSLLVMVSIFMMPLRAFAQRIYVPTDENISSIVMIQSYLYDGFDYDPYMFGSGVVIDEDKRIVITNAHVVLDDYTYGEMGGYEICVTRSQSDETVCDYTASLIYADYDNDLALIQVNEENTAGEKVEFDLNEIKFPENEDISIGQELNILGYPGIGGESITLTSGLVSGYVWEDGEIAWLKTDAKIGYGNSGGGALNENGELIGIPTLISGGYDEDNIGFVRPIAFINDWLTGALEIMNNEDWPVIDKRTPSDIYDLYAEAGDQKVRLTWSPSESSDGIDYYIVAYDTCFIDVYYYWDNFEELPNYFTTTKTDIEITGLENDMYYYFYVLPVSKNGYYGEYFAEVDYVMPLDVAQYFERYEEDLFTDVKADHKNFQAIKYLKDNAVIQGNPDGSFSPDKNLNRAELIKVMVTGQNIDLSEGDYKNCFADVADEWFSEFVCYGKDKGWVEGYPEEGRPQEEWSFKPENEVSRAEAYKMILNAYGMPVSEITESSYTDINSGVWYAKYAETAKDFNLIEDDDSLFWPSKLMTKANIAESLYRLLLIEKAGLLKSTEPWESIIKSPFDLDVYSPHEVGYSWLYNVDEDYYSYEQNVIITDNCDDNPDCYVFNNEIEESNLLRKNQKDLILEESILSQDDEGVDGRIEYEIPVLSLTDKNTGSYFKVKNPTPINLNGVWYEFRDGAVTVSFDGTESVQSEFLDEVVAVKLKISKVMNLSTFDGYYQEFGDAVMKLDETAYYVRDIGLIRAENFMEMTYNNPEDLYFLYDTSSSTSYELTDYTFES